MAIAKRTKAPVVSAKPDSSSKTVTAPAAIAPSAESVAVRAYEIWRESGSAHGNDQAHWFQAERELRTRALR